MSNYVVTHNLAAVTASVTVPPTNLGIGMAPPVVVPLLPGQVFKGTGRGQLDLGNRLGGRQGSIDLLVDVGASGTARTICYLTDNVSSPTNVIAVKVDTSNRPRVVITNAFGTTVAAVTPSYTAIAAGQPVTIRMTWNSQASVDGTRFASLRVNREFVPSANWATDPTSSWVHFVPTHLVLGGSLSDADFNGTVHVCQVSEVVTV